MVRSLTAALAIVFVLGACSSDEDGPKLPETGLAGKVVELSGKVTAKRGETERDLALGADIFVDDTVTTAADGSVTIVLTHNNASWSLGASKTESVRESRAATMNKQAGSAFAQAGDSTTVTAGRNVENETASTAGTVAKTGAPEEASASAGDSAAEPMADGEADTDQRGPGGKAPARVARPSASPQPPPPGGSGADEAAIAKGASPRSLDRRPAAEGGGGSRGGGGLGAKGGSGQIGTIGHGSGTGAGYGKGAAEKAQKTKLTIGKATSGPGLPKEVIRRVMRRYSNQVRYCYERELGKNPNVHGRLVLKFTINADGKVEGASATGDKTITVVAPCVVQRAKRWRFPKPEGAKSVRVSFPLVFRKN